MEISVCVLFYVFRLGHQCYEIWRSRDRKLNDKQSINQPTDRPANWPTARPADWPANQPTNQTTNKLAN